MKAPTFGRNRVYPVLLLTKSELKKVAISEMHCHLRPVSPVLLSLNYESLDASAYKSNNSATSADPQWHPQTRFQRNRTFCGRLIAILLCPTQTPSVVLDLIRSGC